MRLLYFSTEKPQYLFSQLNQACSHLSFEHHEDMNLSLMDGDDGLSVFLDVDRMNVDIEKTCSDLQKMNQRHQLYLVSRNPLGNARDLLKMGVKDIFENDQQVLVDQVRQSLMRRESPQSLSETSAGESMNEVRRRLSRIMNSAVVSIHIFGETGTGKEVIANIFRDNLDKNKPFITVNCAAIAPNLIHSEFFGYVKGAFTGAEKKKVGLFEAADGGWLFLDEVATLSAEAQAALLRALDAASITPVGATQSIPINVRVISACNEDLRVLVEKGRFRRDLYHRLNDVYFHLKPLRERREEIPALVALFCKQMKGGPYEVTRQTLDLLVAMDWSGGNVRELRNCLRAMTENHVQKVLYPSSIPAAYLRSEPALPGDAQRDPASLSEAESTLFRNFLISKLDAQPAKSLKDLAKALNLSPYLLRKKLGRLAHEGGLSDELQRKMPFLAH